MPSKSNHQAWLTLMNNVLNTYSISILTISPLWFLDCHPRALIIHSMRTLLLLFTAIAIPWQHWHTTVSSFLINFHMSVNQNQTSVNRWLLKPNRQVLWAHITWMAGICVPLKWCYILLPPHIESKNTDRHKEVLLQPQNTIPILKEGPMI